MTFLNNHRNRRLLFYIASIFILLTVVMLVVINLFVEPTLKKKLRALVVEGSDSLYTYELGNLNAGFFGGSIKVENLKIRVDSTRFRELKRINALPSLTIKVDLERGDVKGIGLFSLLLGRKITIEEIFSKKADIVLIRHVPETKEVTIRPPLWKSIQPSISGISINKINLDGVKFLYKPADTSESVKLQFDRFDAMVEDIKIDSTSAADSSRIGFAKNMFLRFHDMKFRTPDSSYKMKAEWITYSSKTKTIEIDSFKLQPTLEKDDFYQYYGVQASLYYIEFHKIRLTNTYLDRFLHSNILDADSILLEQPKLEVYLDKTWERKFKSKIGTYPHQKLLQANTRIRISNVLMQKASVIYTEKNGTTNQLGTLHLDNIDLHIKNVTNDSNWIRDNNKCTAVAQGNIFGNSSINALFTFYLDSANGRFDVQGSVKNVSAKQLNALAVPLANIEIPTLNLQDLSFKVKAEDFTAWSDVNMRYKDLSVVLRKTDEATGEFVTRKFLTRVLNKHVINSNNPSANGIERKAYQVPFARLTTQSFFGVIWKSIFAGMQEIMMKT